MRYKLGWTKWYGRLFRNGLLVLALIAVHAGLLSPSAQAFTTGNKQVDGKDYAGSFKVKDVNGEPIGDINVYEKRTDNGNLNPKSAAGYVDAKTDLGGYLKKMGYPADEDGNIAVNDVPGSSFTSNTHDQTSGTVTGTWNNQGTDQTRGGGTVTMWIPQSARDGDTTPPPPPPPPTESKCPAWLCFDKKPPEPPTGPTPGPTPGATPGPTSGPTPGPTPGPATGPAPAPAPAPAPPGPPPCEPDPDTRRVRLTGPSDPNVYAPGMVTIQATFTGGSLRGTPTASTTWGTQEPLTQLDARTWGVDLFVPRDAPDAQRITVTAPMYQNAGCGDSYTGPVSSKFAINVTVVARPIDESADVWPEESGIPGTIMSLDQYVHNCLSVYAPGWCALSDRAAMSLNEELSRTAEQQMTLLGTDRYLELVRRIVRVFSINGMSDATAGVVLPSGYTVDQLRTMRPIPMN